MRDEPLVLLIPWGKSDKRFWPSQNLDIKKGWARAEKNRRGSAPLDTPREDKIPLDPQEKEEPRGNGARRKRKT